jgi:N-acetyltransferase 10
VCVGDTCEKWLYDLLCLGATTSLSKAGGKLPHPNECELYYIERDTLFSFHRASEEFLHRLMGLYVASHYKNTPNDLQMMSDAPAHHLFCLLGPVKPEENKLPEILCVLQVCLEGEIRKESVGDSLARGVRAHGDLIPWTIAQQYQGSCARTFTLAL